MIESFKHRGLRELFETGIPPGSAADCIVGPWSAWTPWTQRDLWLAERRLRDALAEIEPAVR